MEDCERIYIQRMGEYKFARAHAQTLAFCALGLIALVAWREGWAVCAARRMVAGGSRWLAQPFPRHAGLPNIEGVGAASDILGPRWAGVLGAGLASDIGAQEVRFALVRDVIEAQEAQAERSKAGPKSVSTKNRLDVLGEALRDALAANPTRRTTRDDVKRVLCAPVGQGGQGLSGRDAIKVFEARTHADSEKPKGGRPAGPDSGPVKFTDGELREIFSSA